MDLNQIHCCDCVKGMQQLPDACADLILTSPPYAFQRKEQYNSISENQYPKWTVEWMSQCKRILKSSGSVLIIIRTNLKNGRISPYVIRTRLALWEDGWIEPEELIWVKSDSPPLGSTKRLRRAWEHILWFATSGEKVFCNPTATGNVSDRIGLETRKGLGIWKQGACKAKKGISRGKDYFEVGTSKVDKSPYNIHPAQYPSELAEKLISVFSPLNGLVVDPFMGSGTTAVASIKKDRNYIGFDTNQSYCDIASRRITLALSHAP